MLFALVASAPPVGGHGASEGLHLHLSPDPARPGSRVAVEVNASERMRRLRVSFVDHDPVEVQLKRPARERVIRLTVPGDIDGGTLGVHAEAETGRGRKLRASAILRIVRRSSSDNITDDVRKRAW